VAPSAQRRKVWLTPTVVARRSMRVHFLTEASFQRVTDADDNNNNNDDSRITGYFHTRPVTLTLGESLPDFNAIIAELNNQVEQFTCRGSGFVLDTVTKLTIVFARFRQLDAAASSYIQTPAWLANKHAVINVKKLPV